MSNLPPPRRIRPFTPDDDFNVIFAAIPGLAIGILLIVGLFKLASWIIGSLS